MHRFEAMKRGGRGEGICVCDGAGCRQKVQVTQQIGEIMESRIDVSDDADNCG